MKTTEKQLEQILRRVSSTMILEAFRNVLYKESEKMWKVNNADHAQWYCKLADKLDVFIQDINK